MSKPLKIFFLLHFLQPAFAQVDQTAMTNTLELATETAKFEVENYPNVSGSALKLLLPQETTSLTCSPKPAEQSKKQVETEVLLIVDAFVGDRAPVIDHYSRNYYHTTANSIPYLYKNGSNNISKDEDLLLRLNSGLAYYQADFSGQTPLKLMKAKSTLLTYAIFKQIPLNLDKSEPELISSVGAVANQFLSNDQEKMMFLQILSDRLYDNYNNSRNPSRNKNYDPIPETDLSFGQIISSAENKDIYGGGVCNDIAEAIAQVGEQLFPDHDVLTVNEGSHFGTVITDGDKYTIIDGGDAFEAKSSDLFAYRQTPNLRISKVVNGQLKELSVVDSQLGVLLNEGFGKSKKILANDENFSKVMTTIKKSWTTKDKKEKEWLFSLAQAELGRNIQTTVVTAHYTKSTADNGNTLLSSRSTFLGAGTSYQAAGKYLDKSPFSIHLRTGLKQTMIRYKSDKVQLVAESGVVVDGTFANGYSIMGLSGNLTVNNNVKAESKLGKTSLKTEAGIIHELGSSSWGETTGKFSNPSFKKTFQKFGTLSFHLNQVYGSVATSTPLNNQLTLKNSAAYQGSNVGQNFDVVSGIEIKLAGVSKVNTYIGYYNNDIKGYQTKNNLLGGPVSGSKAGAAFEKNNLKVGVEANGLGTKNSTVSGKAVIPLNKKKKKTIAPQF